MTADAGTDGELRAALQVLRNWYPTSGGVERQSMARVNLAVEELLHLRAEVARLRGAVGEVEELVEEVARLRGLLAPLVAKEPSAYSEGDTYCMYCDGDGYHPQTKQWSEDIVHKDDCPWLLARDAMPVAPE